MNTAMRPLVAGVAAGFIALALAGCGGGDGGAARARRPSSSVVNLGSERVRPAPRSAGPARLREVRHAPAKPPIVQDPIPFGARRKAETLAYAQRHYGVSTYRLVDPHVIVIHYTETPDFQTAYALFAPDTPDSELHELPNVCPHFVIDKQGTIHQLVPLSLMCRHTVGLNWTAIGIEHVGYSDQQVLANPRELAASLRLVHWLRCRVHITIANVIGHNESLTSPYHHELVPSLRYQTHGDWVRADMQVYRRRLRQLGGCPSRT